MRKTFSLCALAIAVFAASAAATPRAEAMTVGSSAALRAATHETNLVLGVDYYGYQPYGYYQPYAYYPWYGYSPDCLSCLVERVRVGAWSLHELLAG